MWKGDFDFSQTRMMFISPSYTRYQLKSVEFSDIVFELWKLSKFLNRTVNEDDDFLASISQVINARAEQQSVNKKIKKYIKKTFLKTKQMKQLNCITNLKELIFSEF